MSRRRQRKPKHEPYTHCPRCGSDDLVVLITRVLSLDGKPVDDRDGQILESGNVSCAASCGSLHTIRGVDLDRLQATLDRAADLASEDC